MGSGAGGIFSTASNAGYSIGSQSNHNGGGSSNSGVGSSTASNKCTYCLSFLGSVSMKCSECVNFYLCLKCFSMSAEIGEHKKDHNYNLKSAVSFPIFDSEQLWTYKEELHLLQFIEQYGFDNWEEIGKHLPNRTAEECMQHYHSYYIYGNLGKNTFTTNLKNKLESLPLNNLTSNSTNGSSEHNDLLKQGLANSTFNPNTVLLPPIEMSHEEQRALGYMPLRDDFEREYKNDGEQLLSNLNIATNQLVMLNNDFNIDKYTNNFSQGPNTPIKQENGCNSSSNYYANLDPDDVVDFELKLTLMEMYRECLMERQRFKQIAREYGLVNNASALLNKQKIAYAQTYSSGTLLAPNGLSFNHVSNKKRLKKPGMLSMDYREMSEVNEKLKKYAQFMSVSEYETLLENLRKQRQICKKIQELKTYRSQYGFTKLADIQALKDEQLSKIPMKSRKRKRKSYQMFADLPNKRLTRRQNNSILYASMTNNKDNTLNDTNLTDLNISNIRNFSPNRSSSNSSSRSSSNRSRSNSRSNSSNSMNIYELVEPNKVKNSKNDSIDEDHDQEEDIESENENLENNDQIYTDEDENETSEDLSSGGAASSGGSGINEPNAKIAKIINNTTFGRRSRALNNRRNNSLLIKNKKKKKLNMSLNNSSSNGNKKNMLNASLNKSNLKRTNLLIKSAKSPNGNGKISSKKRKLLDLQCNGRSERLCSMPGYNLLSENEKKLISSIDLKPTEYINFKTNLIKNSLARRKQKIINQQITNFFTPCPPKIPNSPNLNETCPNPTSTPNPCKVTSMMLRRHSVNGNEENGNGDSLAANILSTASAINTDTLLTTNENGQSVNGVSATKTKAEYNKLMSILMKNTCPKYFQIPKSSRKRILRFLCDNGWIDI